MSPHIIVTYFSVFLLHLEVGFELTYNFSVRFIRDWLLGDRSIEYLFMSGLLILNNALDFNCSLRMRKLIPGVKVGKTQNKMSA